MGKISAKEFLNNRDALQIKPYIPYANKVAIVNAVLNETIVNQEGHYVLNSAFLHRLKTQIFIEQLTNLDLSVVEDGLDGYDYLEYFDELEYLIVELGHEYQKLNKIFDMVLEDYFRDRTSFVGFIDTKIENIKSYLSNDLIKKIENIDPKKIADGVKNFVDRYNQVLQK